MKDPALSAVDNELDREPGQDTAEQEAGESIEPYFDDLPQFVELFVLPHYRHQLFKDVRWCARWWEHAAAVTRLEVLWEAFEHMRLDDAPAISVWLRDHFDTHMATLTSPTGVFWKCDATTGIHQIPPLWAYNPAPAGQFSRVHDDGTVVPLTSISKDATRE